ncbi:MAG: hypothetical protein K2X47_19430, partial [Bdellovibrionales bacterium]|nr:hypothetical protein [Bdellovibrionales bacterium]
EDESVRPDRPGSERELETDASPVLENMSEDELRDDENNRVSFEDRKEFIQQFGFDPARGTPNEYDPGPAPDSQWARLFAETPNYRALGLEALGGTANRDEKFRWTFGPMFYRGRLQPERVKVFVVGQEGAQDESVSNRSFTGGTGARMQHFLNMLGVHEDYLFMNTFVYTINGQYNKNQNRALYSLAQSELSPIVIHRHKMFDYMLQTNETSLRLVIAVGSAARDTVATWVRSHAKDEATAKRLCPEVEEAKVTCEGSILGQNIRVIGVPHPGGLGKGADADVLMDKFKRAYTQVVQWNIDANGRWLTPDKVNGRLSTMTPPEKYRYSSAPVPFRDFAFATTWRLGRGGTSSNRKDMQASIQLFSDAGCYNADCTPKKRSPRLRYKKFRDTDATEIAGMPKGDLPWEAPRTNPHEFDPGPAPGFAALLMGMEKNLPYPDFWEMGVTAHKSFGYHGPYRGRLDEAAVLVIGDQESNDDLFTGRAWTGLGGQRLQAYLAALGISRSYAILKTLPVDTFDVSPAQKLKMTLDPRMTAIRNAVVRGIRAASQKKKIPMRAVLAIGPMADRATDQLVQDRVLDPRMIVKLPFPQGDGIEQWNRELPTVKKLLDGYVDKGMRAAKAYAGEDQPIARIDLPIQTKWWVGAIGTRAYRATNSDLKTAGPLRLDPNYYKIYMPHWVFRRKPTELSREEIRQLGLLKKEMDAERR